MKKLNYLLVSIFALGLVASCDNNDEPIIDDGVLLRDMIYLKKEF